MRARRQKSFLQVISAIERRQMLLSDDALVQGTVDVLKLIVDLFLEIVKTEGPGSKRVTYPLSLCCDFNGSVERRGSDAAARQLRDNY